MRTFALCFIASSLPLACSGESSGGPASASTAGSGGHGTSTGPAGGAGGGAAGGGGGTAVAGVPFVYVGASDDRIHVFLLDRSTGALEPKGTVEAGRDPSFLATDSKHRFLYAVNEGSGQVASFAIDAA